MRRTLMVVLVVALATLVFVPAAFAQDDNPSADDLRGDDREGDRGGEQGFDDNPSRDDLGADDNGGGRGFDDNPIGDDLMASPTASASASTTASATASATPTAATVGDDDATATATTEAGDDDATASVGGGLPRTGGVSLLAVAAGVLLVGSGIMAAMLMRRSS
jgi:hypothetical protein